MKRFISVLALSVVLAALFVPTLAQEPKAGPAPGPEEDRMARMMTMMGEMQEQMQGMGPMQARMDRMMSMMGQMNTMMEHHQSEMKKSCSGAAAPHAPNHGG